MPSLRSYAAFIIVALGTLGIVGASPSARALAPSVNIELGGSPVNGVSSLDNETRAVAWSDSFADSFGVNSVVATAGYNGTVLRAQTSVNSGLASLTASSRALVQVANPFVLVANPGFVGSLVPVEIHYDLVGSLVDSGNCRSCFTYGDALVSIDGTGLAFSIGRVHSQSTVGRPDYTAGDITAEGVLQGLLPVNTELVLRSRLFTYGLCQASPGCTTGTEMSMSVTGLSSSATFAWAITPAPIPLPPAGWMMLPALAILAGLCRISARN